MPNLLPRIHYRVVGQDDYMLVIEIASDGGWVIDSGDYTSHEPRQGQLDAAHRERILALLSELGESRALPAPEDATGFVAELTIGAGPTVRHYRFWEGALATAPALAALVREIETIDA